MSDGKWMLYGANGYTGRLIAAEAKRRGLSPILAGRSEQAIRALSDELGFEARVFALEEPIQVAENLAGVSAVLLAAGPFSKTSRQMVDACIDMRIHYLDITGEIAVFEACHALSASAREAGSVVMPGVGFDVVPSDCLAASLAARVHEPESLELAFAAGGFSKGTAKTMVENLPEGGCIRKDGVITRVPAAWRTLEVPFHDRARLAVSIPWGDVSTAFYSTGIPNITTYMAMPRRMVNATRLLRPLLPALGRKPIQDLAKRGVERFAKDPSPAKREASISQFWGRVTTKDGRTIEGTLSAPDSYTLTAMTAVESMRRVVEDGISPGTLTPSKAFGADYITSFEGCDLQIHEAAQPAASPAHP